jgi:hypothetical protein
MSELLQIRAVSPALRARLQASAERNLRSLNAEALFRMEHSFAMEDALTSAQHQKWVDEALASERKPGSVARIREICRQARRAAAE